MRHDLIPAETQNDVLCGTYSSFTQEFGGWCMAQAVFYPQVSTAGKDVFGSVLAVKWDDPNGNWVEDGNGGSGLILDTENGNWCSPAIISFGMPSVPAHISYAIYLFIQDFGSLYWYFSHPEFNNGL